MNHSYLLDTNIISELMKHPKGPIFYKIQKIGEEKICTSIIVASELKFGVRKRGSTKLIKRLEVILDAIDVLPFAAPSDFYYAKIRDVLQKKGTPIGANDLLIAANALSLNLTLVTANIKEFERVPDLKVENWLKYS